MKRIVLGPRAVEEALQNNATRIVAMYLHQRSERARELVSRAEQAGVRWEWKTPEALDALAAGLRHQGVLAITGEYVYSDLDTILREAAPRPLLLALDQITDPHNFGAIVRSAVAFGADGLLTLKDRAAPVTPVVVRSAAGATSARESPA
jgi:23S rRNA (guanosine2251-2'-O)-methyltransferase